MKAKPNNRGEVRQLTAQMLMLLMTRRKDGSFCTTKREAIDDFYYQNLDFDIESDVARRFDKLFTTLNSCLSVMKRKKIQGHEAISLLLLADRLHDDYAPSWMPRFAESFDNFRARLASASKTKWQAQPDEYWLRYGLLARTNSDSAETIERRHAFFVTKMLEGINPVIKDPVRGFGAVEREIIFYRDGKKCQVCDSVVSWEDLEIHHVTTHNFGGKTALANGASVHRSCHPRAEEAVSAFAALWQTKLSVSPQVIR